MTVPPTPAATMPRQRASIVSIPPPSSRNTYQRLLYEQLWRHGLTLAPGASLTVGWLRRHRGSGMIVHFHWPHLGYAPGGHTGGTPEGLELWLAVALFGVRLAAARAFGYRVVWTVHEVYPPDLPGLAHRVAANLLALASTRLIVHDQPTMDACRRLLSAAGKLTLIPHASYLGVYPRRRPGVQVRDELSLGEARFVFLYFGMIRPYKELPLLLTAFERTRHELPDIGLVIAGESLDDGLSREIEEAATRDPRITPILGFVPDHEVAELFDAADACVYPRGDGGTTGTVVLSLSLDTPVIAADTPGYRELLGDERAGWLFAPHDAESLRKTLIRAADPGAAAVKAMRASEQITDRDWGEIGRRTAEVMLSG